jgi:anti-sigma-K factor RskA
MRIDDAATIDRRAREYVLGTLTGRARARFEGLLGANLVARRAVREWEERLVPLALALQPLAPSARVWDAVCRRLGFVRSDEVRAKAAPWRAIAAMLALVAVALAALYVGRAPQTLEPAYVAVVADAEAAPIWLLRAFPDDQSLRAQVVGAAQPPARTVYELWMLPDDKSAPVSLGLLPASGTVDLELSKRQLAVLARTSTLAVSQEPPGGSPTGAPTGPVVFTAPLVRS